MGGPALWSVDPATNDTIDPAVYLAEGQSPPTLNNAVRGVMAGIKAFTLDLSGALVASGTNALTLTTNQSIAAENLVDGYEVAFRVAATNTAPVNLDVDGVSAKPLRRPGNVELGPGDLTTDVVYRAAYVAARSAFIIVSPGIGRPGRIDFFGGIFAVPPGWRICDGTAVSRSAFAALFAAIGVEYGPGDGSATFNLPDGDGRAPFGRDNGKNRLTGAGGLSGAVGSVGGSETVALSAQQMPSHTHGGTTGEAGGVAGGMTGAAGAHNHQGVTGDGGQHSHNANVSGAGQHTHTGSTQTSGVHNHGIDYNTVSQVVTSASTGDKTVVTTIGPNQAVQSGTEDGGGHFHSLIVDAVGDHSHAAQIGEGGIHNHLIYGEPAHQHSIPPAPAHTHGFTTDAAGSGQAHSNIPPGFVGVWAIKV